MVSVLMSKKFLTFLLVNCVGAFVTAMLVMALLHSENVLSVHTWTNADMLLSAAGLTVICVATQIINWMKEHHLVPDTHGAIFRVLENVCAALVIFAVIILCLVSSMAITSPRTWMVAVAVTILVIACAYRFAHHEDSEVRETER